MASQSNRGPGSATSAGRRSAISSLMGTDAPLERHEAARGFSVTLAIAEGGTVRMPLEKIFWAQRFGMPTDKIGISRMINCERPAG